MRREHKASGVFGIASERLETKAKAGRSRRAEADVWRVMGELNSARLVAPIAVGQFDPNLGYFSGYVAQNV
jgi:hypothetical protein